MSWWIPGQSLAAKVSWHSKGSHWERIPVGQGSGLKRREREAKRGG